MAQPLQQSTPPSPWAQSDPSDLGHPSPLHGGAVLSSPPRPHHARSQALVVDPRCRPSTKLPAMVLPSALRLDSRGDSSGHLAAQLQARLLLSQVASSGPWCRPRPCLCVAVCVPADAPLPLTPAALTVHTTSRLLTGRRALPSSSFCPFPHFLPPTGHRS